MKPTHVFAALFIALSALVVTACGGEVEERFDCRKVCETYADCIDSEYDVDECVERCDEQDLGDEADDCEDCTDDNSCTEATFQCGAECSAIVP